MKRKINILFLIYILFVGCASKLSVDSKEDQAQSELIKNETSQIDQSNDFSNNGAYENELNQLINFENIAKEIKDVKERIDFYKYISVYFYEKTAQLHDKYSNKNLFLDIYSADKRIQQKYVKKISKGRNIYNNKLLNRLDLSKQSTIDREIVKSFFSEANYKRDEYIKTYKLLQLKHKDVNNNFTELKISGPEVIYYLDNNEFIIDYKVPVERSKYLQKEIYTDSNENQIYDMEEVFTDCDDELLICEDDCEWEESYGNGRYDEGEPYYDKNLNGIYDTAEIYEDINKNGIYDYDPLNDKNILLNYKSIANNIDDPIEKINFYKSVSEILSVKTKGIQQGFKFELTKMKNILSFYEDQMGYDQFSLDINPPIKNIINYGALKISEDKSNVKVFYNQTKKMMMQYIKLGSYYKNKLQEYNKVVKIIEKDYEHRRQNYAITDGITILDSYEYTSPYLPDSIRFNPDLLLKIENEKKIKKQSKNICNFSNDPDLFEQGFYYRALGEALSLHILDLEIQYQDLVTIYTNTFEFYERKLGYNSTYNLLDEKPKNDFVLKTFLIEVDNHKSISKNYSDQIDPLKDKYIDLKEHYDKQKLEFDNYLRILKYDDSRKKVARRLTSIITDSLLVNEIFLSPYFETNMIDTEYRLLEYKNIAKDISDPMKKAEFYRNSTEALYWGANNKIKKFMNDQKVLRSKIKEYENNLNSRYKIIKPIKYSAIKKEFSTQMYNEIGTDITELLKSSGVDPDEDIVKKLEKIIKGSIGIGRKLPKKYRLVYLPIKLNQGTVNSRIHELQAHIMEKQYNKMNEKLDKHYYRYNEQIAVLDSILLKQDSLFNDNKNKKIERLFAEEKEANRKIIKRKSYKDEIHFLQDISIIDKRNYKRNYIEVGWDRYSNVSEIVWYNKNDYVLKRIEYIYNEVSDLIKTIETQGNNLKTIVLYRLESRGDKFLDYSFDLDFSSVQVKFGEKEYYKKYNNITYLNRQSVFDKMYSKSLSGQVAGIIDVNYDLDGNKTDAIWYIGNREEKIKKIIFPPVVSLEQ